MNFPLIIYKINESIDVPSINKTKYQDKVTRGYSFILVFIHKN